MSENNKLDVLYDVIDLSSNYDDEEILSIITDNIPGLKIGVKLKDSISDSLFKQKVEKFKRYANEFSTSQSFEVFKKKINENEDYRKKVSEYMLLKINKFDTDLKLNIFSKACIDFFESNISEEELENISEIVDLLNKKDLIFIENMFKTIGDWCFVPEKDLHIKELDSSQIKSIAKKLNTLGLLNHEDQVMYKTVSNDPNFVPTYEDPKIYDSFKMTKFTKLLYKYI